MTHATQSVPVWQVKGWVVIESKKAYYEYAISISTIISFERDTVKQVIHAASDDIVFFNSPHHVVEC